jgi:hypothetical protein
MNARVDASVLVEHAATYLASGLSVQPFYGFIGGKCACRDPRCKLPGAHSIPSTSSTNDLQRLTKWLTGLRAPNIGIATGNLSCIFALQVDAKRDGEQILAALEDQHGELPDTLSTTPINGERHIIFKLPASSGIKSGPVQGYPGLYFKADGDHIVAEPSTGPLACSWSDWELGEPMIEIADAPAWLLALAAGRPLPALTIVPPITSAAPESADALPAVSNEDFLRAVIGHLKQGESAWICGFPDIKNPAWNGKPVQLDDPHNLKSDAWNTYFSVGVIAGPSRKKEFSPRMAVLVADDVALTKLSATPSYVIETSPGNHQVGYIIASGGDDLEKCDAVMKEMHRLGWVDKSGNSRVRYARLAVGVNLKERDSGPFHHRLLEWHPELRYSLDEAAKALGIDLTAAAGSPEDFAGAEAPAEGASTMAERLAEWRAAISDPNLDRRSYHDALNRYGACLLATNMAAGAVVETLRAEMLAVKPTAEQCQAQGKSLAEELQRWKERYDDIQRSVSSAQEKFTQPARTDIVVVDETAEEKQTEADRIPGVLGQVEDYYNATSLVNQPAFASVASIALGSVALGRLYVARAGRSASYSSLSLCEVVGTGGGKEHAHTVVNEFLNAAELGSLIGPSGYTSAAGVYSALLSRPNHFAYLNELGKQLSTAKLSNDAHQQQVFTELMMVWASLHKTYRYRGYSTTTLSEAHKALLDKTIYCPAITLLGASTRKALFDAVGAAGVEDGFLNRLLFFFGDDNAQADIFAVQSTPDLPTDVTKWLTKVRDAEACGKGNLWGSTGPDTKPDPVVLTYDAQALDVIRDLHADVGRRIAASKASGMSELWARTFEKATRLALIAAVSDERAEVRREHAEWAARRALSSDGALERVARGNISESKHGRVRNDVYRELAKKGAEGVAVGKLATCCRPYRDSTLRERKEILDTLLADGLMKREVRKAGNGHHFEYLVATRLAHE